MSTEGTAVHLFQPVYREITTRFDPHQKIMWCYMKPGRRSCFTFPLLEDLRTFERYLERVNGNRHNGSDCPIPYMVLTSEVPGIFSYGGDLELFLRCVREGNVQELRNYAASCIDVLFPNFVNYNLPMTTISLVRGDALGGGFEAALSGNVLIAEKGAQFGLPEILFNLFPGMGAYSLLSRRIGTAAAEKIITSGQVYSGAEMHEMGVVDLLAEKGEGEQAVSEFVARHSKKRNALQYLRKVQRRYDRFDREELMDIAELWVEAVQGLGERDIRLMERLIRAQDRLQREVCGDVADARTESPAGSVGEITRPHPPVS